MFAKVAEKKGDHKAFDNQISFKEYADRWEKGPEVMYMVDSTDGYVVQQLREFDGKKLKVAAEEGLDF